jgi:hypothetical protein
VAERGDAEFLQIGVRELREKNKIDVVLGKALGVLPETELLKPISDLLHRGSAPWDYRASPARRDNLISKVAHPKCIAAAGNQRPLAALTGQSACKALETYDSLYGAVGSQHIALAGASVVWPVAAMAQQAGRTYRLGCLLACSAR